MSISERLKNVMNANNLNIKAFSEVTEIPYRSIQNYLRDEREPNVEALLKIRRSLNVNINWLLTGEGGIFIVDGDDSVLTADEAHLIEKYRVSSDSGKRILQATSQILSDEIKHTL
ncbi:helix-turn-helix domain-containing protein [Glaesserella parasuis]|nr:helix-turn-helix domain-containing protein [Glaesserella parasuis]MDE4012140.1 helix-turn-helix domain-containing protein [Glaesserella parasuis]MDO9779313.1 helix-turn-helix transcriptional regulator [Glaesserella parasuis]